MNSTPDASSSAGNLSLRATPRSDDHSSNPLWTVLRDSWDEQLNLGGWINLGVAENVGLSFATCGSND